MCERRRAGLASWAASAANFPASLLPVGVAPTTSRESRRTVCVEKWPEAKPSVTRPKRREPAAAAAGAELHVFLRGPKGIGFGLRHRPREAGRRSQHRLRWCSARQPSHPASRAKMLTAASSLARMKSRCRAVGSGAFLGQADRILEGATNIIAELQQQMNDNTKKSFSWCSRPARL